MRYHLAAIVPQNSSVLLKDIGLAVLLHRQDALFSYSGGKLVGRDLFLIQADDCEERVQEMIAWCPPFCADADGDGPEVSLLGILDGTG